MKVESDSLKAALNVFGPNVSTVRLAAPAFKLIILTLPCRLKVQIGNGNAN